VAGPKTKQSKGEARRSPLATRIVDRWGAAGGDVALDRLISELGDVQRYDIVASLKELERAGAGEFVAGRGGQKARFVWNAGAARQAREAARKAPERKREPAVHAKVEPRRRTPNGRSAPSKESSLEHAFRLRPNVVVSVELPADVTPLEVERFCQFLRAIPFDRNLD
jgi:hypothetical protein